MKRIFAVLLLLAVVVLTGCGKNDGAPKDDTPEPPVLNGVYSGEYGEFVFNGDGSSIEFTLAPEIAEAAGLPEAGEGEYVFTLYHAAYRYDKAERMEMTCGDVSGCFMNKHGETCEDRIVLLSPVEGDASDMTFERGGE